MVVVVVVAITIVSCVVAAPLRGSGGPGAWESMLQAAFSVEFGGLGVERA